MERLFKKEVIPWQWIFLAVIVGIGFILRIYNLNFPSVGYHNMKENEYLEIAENMLQDNDFLKRTVYFYDAFSDYPKFSEYPQIPLVSYQIILAWKIFGFNLWGPRLINVIFGLLSIIVVYFIGYEIFKRKLLALSCSLLLAILPLAVFFSRNLQPESPAFFFI